MDLKLIVFLILNSLNGRAADLETEIEYKVSGEELFRRFLSGDVGAFEELVAMYDQELAVFINRIVNDYHEAKHLTIETFAQLAISGTRFAGKSSIKTYIFTIGKNLAVRYVKMRGREQCIPYEDVIRVVSAADESPQDFMEREENKRLLHKAISSLKEEHRAVLILLYFEDMSYIQAGRAMNKSVKQISDLAYRAKAALKKKLENEGFT